MNRFLKIICVVLIIAIIIFILVSVIDILENTSSAEEYIEGYILCKPNDYINIRPFPNKKGEAIGRMECGMIVHLDGKQKNGFLHCVDLSLEQTEGWVHKGYVVYDEPKLINQNAFVISRGRLAARKTVNGKRSKWLKPMTSIRIYYLSEEWAITNYGYVKSEYLELEGQ